MKTLTNISATVTEADFREPRGILTTVHYEPKPGVQIQIMLGGAGLLVKRADYKVAFPIEALAAVAIANCPELGLIVPEPPSLPPSET